MLVRDAPNGGVLAALDATALFLVRARGPAEGGWRPVEAVTAEARAVGWVEAVLVQDVEPYDIGHGGGSGSPPGPRARRVALPEGTFILPSTPGAEPFARAERRVDVGLVSDDGRWLTVQLETRWDSMYGRVDCPNRGPAPEHSAAEFACVQ